MVKHTILFEKNLLTENIFFWMHLLLYAFYKQSFFRARFSVGKLALAHSLLSLHRIFQNSSCILNHVFTELKLRSSFTGKSVVHLKILCTDQVKLRKHFIFTHIYTVVLRRGQFGHTITVEKTNYFLQTIRSDI